VDTSHQHWVLVQTSTLVPPHAIIRTGLQLKECGMGVTRHYRQSVAQHQRTLALLEAIGPGSDGDSGSDHSNSDHSDKETEGSTDDSDFDTEDEYEGEHRGSR
jgi:hypothetical protein